jgi:adenylate kinase
MIIIIIGPPGSGKTTQSKLLAKKLGVPSISMGQVLRDAKDAKTILGLEASKYVEDGELVPSRLMEALTRFRLEEKDCLEGFVLDGAPRRVEEAVILDEYLKRKNKKVDRVIVINLTDDVAVQRLLKRRNLPSEQGGGRLDDNLSDIKVRMREFEDNIEAVKIYYKNQDLLKQFDGDQTVEEIHQQICSELGV